MKTVKESANIDQENGDTLWWDVIMQEMKNVQPAFEVRGNENKTYQSATRKSNAT